MAISNWGGESTVNTTLLRTQQHPVVAALPNGGYVVAWMDGEPRRQLERHPLSGLPRRRDEERPGAARLREYHGDTALHAAGDRRPCGWQLRHFGQRRSHRRGGRQHRYRPTRLCYRRQSDRPGGVRDRRRWPGEPNHSGIGTHSESDTLLCGTNRVLARLGSTAIIHDDDGTETVYSSMRRRRIERVRRQSGRRGAQQRKDCRHLGRRQLLPCSSFLPKTGSLSSWNLSSISPSLPVSPMSTTCGSARAIASS